MTIQAQQIEIFEPAMMEVEYNKKINEIKRVQDAENLISEFNDRFGLLDDELKNYIYNKLFENLMIEAGVEKFVDTKTSVNLIFSVDKSKEHGGDKLFKAGSETSKNIRFMYKNYKIYAVVDLVNLDEPYQLLSSKFLEKIV